MKKCNNFSTIKCLSLNRLQTTIEQTTHIKNSRTKMENRDFGKSFHKNFWRTSVIPKRNSRKRSGSWLSPPLICAANAKSVAKYSVVCNEMQAHFQVFLHFYYKRKLCRFLDTDFSVKNGEEFLVEHPFRQRIVYEKFFTKKLVSIFTRWIQHQRTSVIWSVYSRPWESSRSTDFPTRCSRAWIKYHIVCVISELNLIPSKITP
jgi:hypothetical protein